MSDEWVSPNIVEYRIEEARESMDMDLAYANASPSTSGNDYH